MLKAVDEEPDLENNKILLWMKSRYRVTETYVKDYFYVRQNGAFYFTPLALVLVLIETTDLVFALDSIPAIFAITSDPFIVYTANVFAILGLRAMYFLLAAVAAKFHLLSYGLAVILVFIGTKMLLIDVVKIPVLVSLGVVVAVLAITMVWSVKTAPRLPQRTADEAAGG